MDQGALIYRHEPFYLLIQCFHVFSHLCHSKTKDFHCHPFRCPTAIHCFNEEFLYPAPLSNESLVGFLFLPFQHLSLTPLAYSLIVSHHRNLFATLILSNALTARITIASPPTNQEVLQTTVPIHVSLFWRNILLDAYLLPEPFQATTLEENKS